MNKIYPFTTPANYAYDNTKVEVVNGVARLKKQIDPNIYAHWHLNEAAGATVIDSSGNGRNGTPVNSPLSVVGKLNNCLQFNGSNQYVDCGDIANFEKTDPFSVEFWFNTTSAADRYIISKQATTPKGWGVRIYQGLIWFTMYSSASDRFYSSTNLTYHDGLRHLVIVTYDGSNNKSGMKIYVDNVSDYILAGVNTIIGSIINGVNCQISGRGGLYALYYDSVDEVVIYDKVLSEAERTERWNNGNGTEILLNSSYPVDKPIMKPTTSWTISGLSQFTALVQTLGGGNAGSIGYQLSDDDGINYRYWNGSAWVVTSDLYNDATTVHTNIGSFPVSNEKIMFRAFLISDGTQQCELDTLEFTALVGDPPVVYSGADKDCYDHQTVKLFNDATISDPDGDIEQASAWYNVEGSGWIQIPKGGYGTLQEAIRNFQWTFDNIGVQNCQLKLIDQTSKETIDDLNITCKKYTVTFNIKDKDGNHLANFQFLPNDGSDWQTLNSPFNWDYVWKSSDYKIIVDKVGFQTAKADVVVSVHTENITMSVLGAVSPEEVADAVWNELRGGHTITNSFGEKNQNKVPSENVTDYRASEADLGAIKVNTDKIPSIKTETDKMDSIKIEINKIQSVKAKTDNLPTDPTSETNATVNKNAIITEVNSNETKLNNLDILIKRILGLNKENYKLYDTVYDGNQQLVTGKIKIYPTAADLDNDINALGIYQINTEYNANATCKTFWVKKI